MSSLLRPFAALRPSESHAAAVAAPPYDVLSSEEARACAAGRPWSFLHISKAEIDLVEDVNPYAPEVYAKAAENLRAMIAAHVLERESQPCFYAYRMIMGEHQQTGVAAVASVAHYDSNRIRKHEFTRPDKEDDRVRQIDALNAQTGPVLLAYPKSQKIAAELDAVTSSAPLFDVLADTGVRHIIWRISAAEVIAGLTREFDTMNAIYICDGHHRSAAASRIAAQRRFAAKAEASHERFLAVAFPHDQMRILSYNRVITDLHGHTVESFLGALRERFEVTPVSARFDPTSPAQFGLYLARQWYGLKLRSERIPQHDPVARLDVSLLADNVLAPILGITDARRDKRIDFVGGIRGLTELERRVNSGEMACAFSMFATRMEDLMAVADANEVMPPKSTWFEPKLADGLLSHVLD